MEWVETTGSTVAAALEAALDVLGVDEHDAEVVILEEPRTGLFGLRRGEARVRARVRPSAPRPKRPQRGRSARDQGESRSRSAGAGTRRPSERGVPPPGQGGSASGAAAGGADQARRAPRRRGGRRGGAAARARVEARGEEGQMTVEQEAELVGAFVRGVVERFGFDATTSVRVEDDAVAVEVDGDDLGLLIGPRGATLDALQELARTVLQRRGGEQRAARVSVDVAGFRARRAAALAAFARRAAAEVLETGETQALEPMSAADRKIVHDAVNPIEGVETASEGVEPGRYVVIRPAARRAAGAGAPSS
ncbi:MAG TPA: RNA-binding cell elongation regulator Jag/EloR [Acidimicrobiales bacterium]|nr:RNA-binding cell elongation regulator Jag/EloR [Acidimicrobiales bacterium]